MTNEDLALLARSGDNEAIVTLWRQVERFARSQARKWAAAGLNGAELSDLMQAGAIATIRAAEALLSVDENDFAERRHADLMAVINTLPDGEREEIINRYWYDRPRDNRLHNAALKHLRHPSRSRLLREYAMF